VAAWQQGGPKGCCQASTGVQCFHESPVATYLAGAPRPSIIACCMHVARWSTTTTNNAPTLRTADQPKIATQQKGDHPAHPWPSSGDAEAQPDQQLLFSCIFSTTPYRPHGSQVTMAT
jgi:hypothetical protein